MAVRASDLAPIELALNDLPRTTNDEICESADLGADMIEFEDEEVALAAIHASRMGKRVPEAASQRTGALSGPLPLERALVRGHPGVARCGLDPMAVATP